MNNQDQPKLLENTLYDEGYQERGLRILGKIIARDLMKQQKDNKNRACNRKPDDSPKSGEDA